MRKYRVFTGNLPVSCPRITRDLTSLTIYILRILAPKPTKCLENITGNFFHHNRDFICNFTCIMPKCHKNGKYRDFVYMTKSQKNFYQGIFPVFQFFSVSRQRFANFVAYISLSKDKTLFFDRYYPTGQ